MSQTVCLYPVVGAISAADQILGPDRVWKPTNGEQKRFLDDFYEVIKREIPGIPEIETIASWEAKEINSFLADRGFNIKLEDFGADCFGVAAALILLLEWKTIGRRCEIQSNSDGKTYDGVRISGGDGLRHYKSSLTTGPIVLLETKSGDKVYLSPMAEPPSGFDLVAHVERLQASLEDAWAGGVIFPMVDLDQLVDVSWLLDMNTVSAAGQPARIVEAKQQTMFKMNEKGALLKSAAAAVICLESMPPPDVVIDQPFLVWVTREGLKRPLLAAHITQEDWKNPGELHS